LVELHELGAARSMLRQTAVFDHMRGDEQQRYKHLEDLLTKPYFDPTDVCMQIYRIYVYSIAWCVSDLGLFGHRVLLLSLSLSLL
jgi:hypothetical protein